MAVDVGNNGSTRVFLLISGHLELEADCNLRIEVPTKLLSTLRVSTGTK